ncbi:MAG: MaoC/PaaZ C-terminal domain-containing protein [Thermoleophilaceae bacterium]
MNDAFTSRARTITEADVVAFASLTGDFHPQHSDAVWAADSAFGERIAHGMLIVSYAVGLVAFDPERVVALRRLRDVVFKRPVRLGDTIHVEGSEADRRPVDDETALVTWNWRIVNQDGDLVCRVAVEALVRDPAEVTA